MSKKEKTKRDIRIFLSYAREDRNKAEQVIKQLATQPNIHVFTVNQMSAGENWKDRIKKELAKSDFFLVLLSPASIRSKWVQLELGAAWGLDKFIIPIVTSRDLVSKLPLEFTGTPVVDMEYLKRPEGLNQIMELYEQTAA
jgi:hypothetical protein